MSKRKLLVVTGGGDCPGLNAVLRGIVKRSKSEGGWNILGSKEAFNGVLSEPMDLMKLNGRATAGIHM